MGIDIEIRKYHCTICNKGFWVDCDDSEYPCYCPFCGGYEGDFEVFFDKANNTSYILSEDD